MYKDPQEREEQIRNMSEAFRELADGILPELRRSRLTINYETVGRSDEEIKALLASDPMKLSADELLYAASLEKDPAKKEEIYKKTSEYYDRDYRAYNNLAALEMRKGNYDQAQTYLNKAAAIDRNGGEIYANEGLIALKNGNLAEAENLMLMQTSPSSRVATSQHLRRWVLRLPRLTSMPVLLPPSRSMRSLQMAAQNIK